MQQKINKIKTLTQQTHDRNKNNKNRKEKHFKGNFFQFLPFSMSSGGPPTDSDIRGSVTVK